MPSSSYDQNYDAITDATGTATITIVCPSKLRPWTITQVSVEMPTASGYVQCMMRKNGNIVTPMVASGDAAAGEPPVNLTVSDVLTIVWTGAVPGDVARANIFYTEGTW